VTEVGATTVLTYATYQNNTCSNRDPPEHLSNTANCSLHKNALLTVVKRPWNTCQITYLQNGSNLPWRNAL